MSSGRGGSLRLRGLAGLEGGLFSLSLDGVSLCFCVDLGLADEGLFREIAFLSENFFIGVEFWYGKRRKESWVW